MTKVLISPQFCKGCRLCIIACKNDVLQVSQDTNAMGYHPVVADENKECIGCKMCAIACPEAAIEILK